LPESLRTPLLLFYMENYTEKETARALGITVTAVKNRLFRARRALKQRLTDWEVAPK
jgi:RNA polymerase sigma-70 factor (ECF subfamily)